MNIFRYFFSILTIVLCLWQSTFAQQPEGSLHTFKFYIVSKDSAKNKNIPGADVLMTNGTSTFAGKTDTTGNYNTTRAFADFFNFYAGKWGYNTRLISKYIDSATEVIFMPMLKGYYDDFFFVNAWKSSALKSMTWKWVTADTGAHSLSYPNTDDTTDYGNTYMQTGNGTKYVDTGSLRLFTPLIDLSNYSKPVLNFSLYMSSQVTLSTDSICLYMVSGTDTTFISGYPSNDSVAIWNTYSVVLTSSFPHDTGHILIKAISHTGTLKAGLDKFYITGITSGVDDIVLQKINPCTKNVQVKCNNGLTITLNNKVSALVDIYDVQGQRLGSYALPQQQKINAPLNTGFYILKVNTLEGTCVKPVICTH